MDLFEQCTEYLVFAIHLVFQLFLQLDGFYSFSSILLVFFVFTALYRHVLTPLVHSSSDTVKKNKSNSKEG